MTRSGAKRMVVAVAALAAVFLAAGAIPRAAAADTVATYYDFRAPNPQGGFCEQQVFGSGRVIAEPINAAFCLTTFLLGVLGLFRSKRTSMGFQFLFGLLAAYGLFSAAYHVTLMNGLYRMKDVAIRPGQRAWACGMRQSPSGCRPQTRRRSAGYPRAAPSADRTPPGRQAPRDCRRTRPAAPTSGWSRQDPVVVESLDGDLTMICPRAPALRLRRSRKGTFHPQVLGRHARVDGTDRSGVRRGTVERGASSSRKGVALAGHDEGQADAVAGTLSIAAPTSTWVSTSATRRDPTR